MPVETIDGVPSSFHAGETVRFEVEWTDYPATGWALAFNLKSNSSWQTVAGVANGTAFIVTLTASQTAALTPGWYNWTAVLTEAGPGDTFIPSDGTGQLQVKPSALVSAKGPRRLAYEAALAALESLSAKKFQSVSVEGESYTLQNVDQLAKLVEVMRGYAFEEDAAYGLPVSGGVRRIKMRLP